MTRPTVARWITLITVAAILAAALLAHVGFFRHAGGLWRDEAGTAAFARMSITDLRAELRYDSVPLVSTLLFRSWTAIGFGSDTGLRTLGLAVGCAVLLALLLNARMQGAALPCSLALFACLPWVIRGGDAVRPLGLAMVLIVMTFAAVGALLEAPRRGRVVAAMACAVLAVQTSYANVPLVAAITLAAMIAGGRAHCRARVLAVLAVALAAAVSLLPYAPMIRDAQDWGVLMQVHNDLARLWLVFRRATTPDTGVWVAAVTAALVAGVVTMTRTRRKGDEGEASRAVYAGATLGLAVVAFVAFLSWSELATQPWYYLPLLALLAAAIDVLGAPFLRSPAPRIAACILLVGWMTAHVPNALAQLRVRQTNLDLIAAKVAEAAGPADLVVVNPWFYATTFDRYYHGPARWTVIPPLAETRIHRYDLLKRCMQDVACILPVEQEILATFAAGGRVWVAGYLPPGSGGRIPPPPAAPAELGWNIDKYSDAWGKAVITAIVDRAIGSRRVAVESSDEVSTYEDAALFVITGR
ncbi:MAG TPA: hypothetical protein VGK30_03360 [Candidatus Binatia bacterium]|jgi:hypothetical protein